LDQKIATFSTKPTQLNPTRTRTAQNLQVNMHTELHIQLFGYICINVCNKVYLKQCSVCGLGDTKGPQTSACHWAYTMPSKSPQCKCFNGVRRKSHYQPLYRMPK